MATGINSNEEFNHKEIKSAFEKARADLKRVNIVLIGQTGIGKSTLINTVVGREVVKTGIGAPVTKRLRYIHENKDSLLGVYDTVGFEIGKSEDELLDDIRTLIQPDEKLQRSIRCPHVVWFCVAGNSTRLQPQEEALIHSISELGLPVALVMTQTPNSKDGIHARPRELSEYVKNRNLPIVNGEAFLTCALPDSGLGMQNQFGVKELIGAIFQSLTGDEASAFAAEQVLAIEVKDAAADRDIYLASAAAVATGAIPLPFSDAAVLVPAQIALMMRIAHIYGFALNTTTIISTVTSKVLQTAGVRIVSGLLKFIPGIGTFVGGVIAGTTAGALTYGMGIAWKQVCRKVYLGELDPTLMHAGSAAAEEFLSSYKSTSISAFNKYIKSKE